MPAARKAPAALTTDVVWPRVPAYRYRLYRRNGVELDVIAAAPDPGGIGLAITTIHDDMKGVGRRLSDLGFIGILDVRPGQRAGEWVLLPWARGEVDRALVAALAREARAA